MAQVSDGELVGQTTLEGLQSPLYATEEQLVVLRRALIGYAIDREQRLAETRTRAYDSADDRDARVAAAMRFDQDRAVAADMALDVERLLKQLRGD